MVANRLGIERWRAKNVLFASIYGADAPKLAETAGVPLVEATGFIKRLREEMPSLAEWPERVRDMLVGQGYAETAYGWRNYYPLFWSPLPRERSEALRQAANLPIQGTAAGVLKELFKRVERADLPGELVLTVHDEVVFEVETGWATYLAEQLEILGGDYGFGVPLPLEVKIGPNWADMKGVAEWVVSRS
jgi:DNA polymerase-1